MKIFFSESLDPFFHLAVEEWLLRSYPLEQEVWFIYRNRPCVVLGRFQNPWLECDLGWMHEQQIPLVRRPSGGGTVWHDPGNVNFCRVTPLKGFHKNAALEVIQSKLASVGVPVQINARHDLVVEHEGLPYKVSGSAYKQTKDRSLHHGTLLIQSDLSQLALALKSPHQLLETKSIPSVRSRVKNLSEFSSLTVEKYLSLWEEFTPLKPQDFDATSWQQWQWVMGETPLFRWRLVVGEHEVELSSHKGLIHELKWPKLGLSYSKLLRPLTVDTFSDLSQGKIIRAEWLRTLGA